MKTKFSLIVVSVVSFAICAQAEVAPLNQAGTNSLTKIEKLGDEEVVLDTGVEKANIHFDQKAVKEKRNKKHVLKGITTAFKSYKTWKMTHKEEARTFLARAKKFRSEISNNQSLKNEIASIQNSCNDSTTSEKVACQKVQKDKLANLLSREMNSSEFEWSSLFISTARADDYHALKCGGYEDNFAWHAGVYGKFDSLCDQGNGDVWATQMNFGPGLEFDYAHYEVYLCARGITSGQTFRNFGPSASVSAIAGVRTGLLFGESGVCLMLGANLVGGGGYAGFTYLEFGPR